MAEVLLSLIIIVGLITLLWYITKYKKRKMRCGYPRRRWRRPCGQNSDIYGSGSLSYIDTVVKKNIEKSTFDSHREYINDLKSSPNASNHLETIREEMDINSWVGLRRPQYDKLSMGTDSRIVPSYIYSQTPSYNSLSKFL